MERVGILRQSEGLEGCVENMMQEPLLTLLLIAKALNENALYVTSSEGDRVNVK